MELLKVDTVEQARQKLWECSQNLPVKTEAIPFEKAVGRVLAQDVFAGEPIPAFRRSTVDGYAVVAADTAAAGDSIPVFLALCGKVEMGRAANFSLQSGECAYVPTGGMLPAGADGVVMVEYSEEFGLDGIALYSSVATGQHVVQIGEDAAKGEKLLEKGRVLNAQSIGALAAAGIRKISVYEPLTATILSTGDELAPPDTTQLPQGQVRDINTYALQALAEKNGYRVVHTQVLVDDETALKNAVETAMQNSDVVFVSGGSSQGDKDATCRILASVSGQGVFTHGMAIKPGKPTILGYDKTTNTLLAGLPGHPVSAMMVFEMLFSDLYRRRTKTQQPPAVVASLASNVASSPGKVTCWPVALSWNETGYTAQPIFGKSGLITTLTKADGYFTVEQNTEGLAAGQTVRVHLF